MKKVNILSDEQGDSERPIYESMKMHFKISLTLVQYYKKFRVIFSYTN